MISIVNQILTILWVIMMNKKKILLWSVVAAALVLVGVILLVIFWPKQPANLVFGPSAEIASAVIPSSGGEIEVADSNTALDGLTITVPDGAYAQDTEFSISMAEIQSHKFGELFNPVTPLISIDNGHGFAEEPMIVTIPIEKAEDEFAMAFYYDQSTGELEGIPFLDVTNDSITIITAHFSDLVVTKEKAKRITAQTDSDFALDTGFKPGFNDFQMPNSGSVMAPGGHCAGQSIAAMFYYNNRGRIGWDKPLNGLLDNIGLAATPDLTWDDASAIRLSSVVHQHFVSRWGGNINQPANNVLYAFAYSIALTHQPQFIDIRATNSAHAMIIYKVTTNALYVADPNFPGQERLIKYKITNGTVHFESYFSGDNYEQATTNSKEYTQFNYFGLYSLINKAKVQQVWLDTLKGKDPGAVLFPADKTFMIRVGKDPATGNFIDVPLTDGMIITRQQFEQSGYESLLVYPTTYQVGEKFWFYNATQSLGSLDQPNKGLKTIVPQSGDNDLGILYHKLVNLTAYDGTTSQVYRYINFYRFNIIFQDAPVMSVSPESPVAFIGDSIPFKIAISDAPSDALYTWDFGDGQTQQTDGLTLKHAYAAEGAFYGRVSVASAANPSQELAYAEFSAAVFKNEDITTQPTTTPSGTSNAEGWTTVLSTGGGISEKLYTESPPSIPQDVGAKSTVSVASPGQLRVTVNFASSMGTGPRFYGDDFGYRSYAAVILRDADGKLIKSDWIYNDYDTSYAEQILTIEVPSPQTISIQVVPQGVSCYAESKVPASDGEGYLYLAGSYTLQADFMPGD